LSPTLDKFDDLDKSVEEIKKMINKGFAIVVIKDPKSTAMAIAIENPKVEENNRERYRIIIKGSPEKIQKIIDRLNGKRDVTSIKQEKEQELLKDDDQIIYDYNKKLVKMNDAGREKDK